MFLVVIIDLCFAQKPEEKSIITYLSCLYHAFQSSEFPTRFSSHPILEAGHDFTFHSPQLNSPVRRQSHIFLNNGILVNHSQRFRSLSPSRIWSISGSKPGALNQHDTVLTEQIVPINVVEPAVRREVPIQVITNNSSQKDEQKRKLKVSQYAREREFLTKFCRWKVVFV